MVFLQRFRCTTEPIGGGTEYDEEGELVSWDAAVAAIEIAMKRLGWLPASECPKVGENGDVEVIVIQDNYDVDKAIYCEIEGIGMWDLPNIKWWCYPPKED